GRGRERVEREVGCIGPDDHDRAGTRRELDRECMRHPLTEVAALLAATAGGGDERRERGAGWFDRPRDQIWNRGESIGEIEHERAVERRRRVHTEGTGESGLHAPRRRVA